MLSTTSEHALRALGELTGLGDGELMLGKDLAQRAAIPANYLSKVLWVLGSAGIIEATRGSGGGYRLRRRAGEIRLAEIVELFERQPPANRCLLGGGRECNDRDPCGAHQEWSAVRARFVEFLERTTLEQIAPQGLCAALARGSKPE
jgi:Rrf2 family protein